MPVDSLRDRGPFRLIPFTLSIAKSATLAASLSGCAMMSEDVHEYYTTMAQNNEEAAERTKMQIVTLKSKARELIQAGEIAKAKKIQHEISRIEDWQIKRYRDRDRFAKAARDLEKKTNDKAAPTADKYDDSSSTAPKSPISQPRLQ